MSSETEKHREVNVIRNYSDKIRAPIISKVKENS